MPNETKNDPHEWVPGVLADNVSVHAPCGISQMWAMMVISKALAEGRANPVVENIEVTISITDDAIHHMMRKR